MCHKVQETLPCQAGDKVKCLYSIEIGGLVGPPTLFKKWTRCSRRSKQTFLYLLVAEEHLAENLGLEWIQEVYKLGYHLTGAATSTSYSRTIRRPICSAFVSLAVHVWDWTRCPVEMFRKITLIIEGFSLHLIWPLESIQQSIED